MGQEDEELRQQLVDVQTQLAFQEDTVQSLSEAMAVQQQEILVLRRQLELLKQRQDEQSARYSPGDEAAPALEKPPHY